VSAVQQLSAGLLLHVHKHALHYSGLPFTACGLVVLQMVNQDTCRRCSTCRRATCQSTWNGIHLASGGPADAKAVNYVAERSAGRAACWGSGSSPL